MSDEYASTIVVPTFAVLAQELASLRPQPRAEALKSIKDIREREMALSATHLHDHMNEVTGLDVTLGLSGLADVIIRELVVRAMEKVKAPSDWQHQVGVFALGGYGRGELNPCSDIDLLVLSLDPRIPAWLSAANAELQSSMWDVKFQVGASMRSAPELERIVDDDFVTATALLEQRPLIARGAVTQALQHVLERFRKRRSVPFLKYKIEELAKRREQAGISLLQMEPNLKTNPGCLRDVQLLRNVAFIVSGARNLLTLSELDVITRQDLMSVAAANDHLLRIRSLLHFEYKRKQDVFRLPDQLTVAKQLGYQAISQLRAVEYFMKHHYGLVMHVHQCVELVVSRLRAKGFLGKWTLLIKTRKTIDQDFTAVQGQVYVGNPAFWNLSDVPLRLMRMCRVAQERGLRLSLELQRTIRTNLERINDDVRRDPDMAKLFLTIVGDLGRTRLILEDMHNCGFLGAYLPEFGNLTCHMQFDSYHQFTVDQHTLFAMGNLDAVMNGTQPGLPGMPEMLRNVKRKDLLGLGLLLHDMGKYMGRGHVARGAMMVAGVASRLGFDREETDVLHWLVDRHVALSDASRMRDFHDPAFLNVFAEKMGNRTQLDMLYCLTYADAKAVGEGVLTGWQESILKELHTAVSDKMRSSSTDVHLSRHDRLLGELKASNVSGEVAEQFIEDMGPNYIYQVPRGEVERHFQVRNQALASGIGLDHIARDKYTLLAIAIPDRHGLFADVTAALTGHGFDILDARVWVTRSQIVVYSFRTISIFPTRLAEEATWKKLRHDIEALKNGKLSPEAVLDRRRSMYTRTPVADSVFDDPAVKVEQRTSDHFTVIDVHVKDSVGLLSRLCRAIADYKCTIGYASINTMGDVAVDTFYINRDGAKLSDAEAEDLRRHVITAMGLQIC